MQGQEVAKDGPAPEKPPPKHGLDVDDLKLLPTQGGQDQDAGGGKGEAAEGHLDGGILKLIRPFDGHGEEGEEEVGEAKEENAVFSKGHKVERIANKTLELQS